MFIPLFARLNEPADVAWLMVTLFVGFAIVGRSHSWRLFSIWPVTLSRRAAWRGFAAIYAAFTVWVVVAFRHNIKIVSFSEIYDLREAANDVKGGPLLNYSLMWLYGALNPFLIGWGLRYRRAWLFWVGVAGQFLVYTCYGTKASLLSIVFILGIYLIFRIGQAPFSVKFTWGLVALLAGLCVALAFSGDEPGAPLSLLSFLVFFRSLGLAGLLTGQYYYFFGHNPHTFYSHVTGFNWIVHYPFGYPLGTELGLIFTTP